MTHYLNTTGQILIDFALVSSGVLIDTTASGQDTEGLIWETHAPPDSHRSSHWENMEISIWSPIKTYSSETNPDHIRTDVNETWWLLLQKDCGGTEMPLFIVFCMLTQWQKSNLYKSFPHLLSILKAVQLKNNFLFYWVKPTGSRQRHAARCSLTPVFLIQGPAQYPPPPRAVTSVHPSSPSVPFLSAFITACAPSLFSLQHL